MSQKQEALEVVQKLLHVHTIKISAVDKALDDQITKGRAENSVAKL